MDAILDNPTITATIGVVVALVAFVVGFIFYQRSRSVPSIPLHGVTGKYPSVVIYGPMGSGKTVLFYQLYNSEYKQTQTSMNENILEFAPKNMAKVTKTYQFIDFPGHGSKESQIFKYILQKHNNKGMKGLIVTVDINDNNSLIEASKKLYRLLERKAFYQRNAKVLILLNKKDELDNVVNIFDKVKEKKSAMLHELNKLRESYSSKLQSINEGGDDETIVLGNENQTLTWNDIGCTIEWGVASASKGQLEDVESFLSKL